MTVHVQISTGVDQTLFKILYSSDNTNYYEVANSITKAQLEIGLDVNVPDNSVDIKVESIDGYCIGQFDTFPIDNIPVTTTTTTTTTTTLPPEQELIANMYWSVNYGPHIQSIQTILHSLAFTIPVTIGGAISIIPNGYRFISTNPSDRRFLSNRMILGFDTSLIPNTITMAKLRIKIHSFISSSDTTPSTIDPSMEIWLGLDTPTNYLNCINPSNVLLGYQTINTNGYIEINLNSNAISYLNTYIINDYIINFIVTNGEDGPPGDFTGFVPNKELATFDLTNTTGEYVKLIVQ